MNTVQPIMHSISDDTKITNVLNEIRNTLLGGSILLSGFLWIPFTQRFVELSLTGRIFYLIAMLSMLAAVILLVAVGVQQQIHPGIEIVDTTVRPQMILGACFLHVGLFSIVGVISNFVFGVVAATIICGVFVITTLFIWIPFPLLRSKCVKSQKCSSEHKSPGLR